ncbi:MAG: hypothetical protein FJ320_01285 [SAR202 cluster bacterium]|nr:hypothetical protein [SAR202 cluster bacterium]
MRKERMVASRLPEELLRDLETIESVEQTDRSTTVRKLLARAVGDWKLSHYASLYGKGKISMARAAQESGVSIWEMMEYVRRDKIAVQYDLKNLKEDLETLAASKD